MKVVSVSRALIGMNRTSGVLFENEHRKGLSQQIPKARRLHIEGLYLSQQYNGLNIAAAEALTRVRVCAFTVRSDDRAPRMIGFKRSFKDELDSVVSSYGARKNGNHQLRAQQPGKKMVLRRSVLMTRITDLPSTKTHWSDDSALWHGVIVIVLTWPWTLYAPAGQLSKLTSLVGSGVIIGCP
jgi:hypothetical protein